MNKLIKDALILTLITLVSGVALGFVHRITEEPIALAQAQQKAEAYMAVFPQAEACVDQEGFDAAAATEVVRAEGYSDDIENCANAYDDEGNQLGYVITVTSHAGYGGDITLIIGITNEGVMNAYEITDISETAGLGMKSKEPKFKDQFVDLAVQALTVVKASPSAAGEIEAISGATITSRAVTNAVNAAFSYFAFLTEGVG